jgi:hypothetical protein
LREKDDYAGRRADEIKKAAREAFRLNWPNRFAPRILYLSGSNNPKVFI